MQSVFLPFPLSPSLLPHPTVYLPHPFCLPLPPSLPSSPLRRSISVTGVHQGPALSAMDISLLLCGEQEDLSQESAPPRQRLKVPGSGQSSTASSLASSRRGMCVRRREGRRGMAEYALLYYMEHCVMCSLLQVIGQWELTHIIFHGKVVAREKAKGPSLRHF